MPEAPADSFLRPFTGAPTVLAFDARPRPLRRTADGRVVGAPVISAAAVAAGYEARLTRLIDEMSRSVLHWLRAAWRREAGRIKDLAMALDKGKAEGSVLALDAPPAGELDEVVRRLARRWGRRFDEASEELAKYFATAAHRRSSEQLKRILKRGGFAIEFRVSVPIRSALRAIVAENVALIKSIPRQHLTQVQGSVMRAVLAGGDLKTLTEDLQRHDGVTRRRAEFIARDQNRKATSAITRLQYLEGGIERAIWRHSHAGAQPRPTHVANDGKEYSARTGWWDPAEKAYIWPGQLINCRCFDQPILPR